MLSSVRASGLVIALSTFALAGCGGGGSASGTSSLPTTTMSRQNATLPAAHSVAAVGTQLFYDDFEDNSTALWTPQNGSLWSVCQPPGKSHEYCTPGNAAHTHALSTAGNPAWTDYEVDAWAVPGSTLPSNGVELLARYAGPSSFYQFELKGGAGEIWTMYKATPTGWTLLGSGPTTFSPGSYYHMRFVLNGSTLTGYATTTRNDWTLASEKLLGTVTDPTYASGAIAVRAIGGGAVRFDNVGVYALASPTPAPSPAPTANPALHVPAGFYADQIATIGSARQLAVASNGDLLVGTEGNGIAIVPNAESDGAAGAPQTLISLPEGPAQGISLGPNNSLYAATNTGVWRMPYTPGDRSVPAATKIAAVRTGPIAPNSDGDVHRSSSVIVTGGVVYVGVGSSCNACTEVDPTRATVQRMALDGTGMATYATRIRNPMAFTVNPATGTVWTGGAGQDSLAQSHPYEYLDGLTLHAAVADYGWPVCEENHVAYTAGAQCANTVAPLIEFPAYSTIIGAAFYPLTQTGSYAFPSAYRGGVFVSMHGSWHAVSGVPVDAPHVAFVAMNGDTPRTAVNWSDPTAQWTEFFTGFQSGGNRIGRTTGIAVGPRGSLFVADDQTGHIYRIRPGTRP